MFASARQPVDAGQFDDIVLQFAALRTSVRRAMDCADVQLVDLAADRLQSLRNLHAYLALRSQRPYRWCEEGEWAGREVIVEGKRTIWLCELGSRAENGSFGEFCAAICAAPLAFRANIGPWMDLVGKDAREPGDLLG